MDVGSIIVLGLFVAIGVGWYYLGVKWRFIER